MRQFRSLANYSTWPHFTTPGILLDKLTPTPHLSRRADHSYRHTGKARNFESKHYIPVCDIYCEISAVDSSNEHSQATCSGSGKAKKVGVGGRKLIRRAHAAKLTAHGLIGHLCRRPLLQVTSLIRSPAEIKWLSRWLLIQNTSTG